MFGWLKKTRVRALVNQAFFAAEQGYFEGAVAMLSKALEIAPDSGHANNEMGFCLLRLGDLRQAEVFARKAVASEPENPKFANSMLAIQLEAAKKLSNRKAISDKAQEMLRSIHDLVKAHPNYAPAYLSEATILALAGASRAQWEAALIMAGNLYETGARMASGLPSTSPRIQLVMAEHIRICQELSQRWSELPESDESSRSVL